MSPVAVEIPILHNFYDATGVGLMTYLREQADRREGQNYGCKPRHRQQQEWRSKHFPNAKSVLQGVGKCRPYPPVDDPQRQRLAHIVTLGQGQQVVHYDPYLAIGVLQNQNLLAKRV